VHEGHEEKMKILLNSCQKTTKFDSTGTIPPCLTLFIEKIFVRRFLLIPLIFLLLTDFLPKIALKSAIISANPRPKKKCHVVRI